MPPNREGVPVKYLSTKSCESPMASNTCAPVYEATVEIPILLMTLSKPLPKPFTRFRTAVSGEAPATTPVRTKFSTDSIAKYGFTAAAP